MPISNSVTNGNKATCWAAFSPDGKHVYTANAGSNNVSTYSIGTGGSAAIQQSGVATGGAADGPLDGAVTPDGAYYVQLLGKSGEVATFAIDGTGNLATETVTTPVLPAPGAQGLAVR
jgi:DNA-binding beta-propeller fold protein YncE